MARFDPEAREREARAEIGATRIPRRVAVGLAALFLLVLALGPALELGAAARGRSRVVQPLPVREGPLATARAVIAELELRFDERSELVRSLRPAAQELLTRGLGYGNERAYVGRDGWLFFRPAFDHLTARPTTPTLPLEAAEVVAAFRDELSRRGVALVVLPVPVKLSVRPDRFVSSPPPAPVRPRAELEFLAHLERSGIEVVDPARRIARRPGGEAAYLERDTHWRPEVVDDVARDLAIRLRDLVELPPGDPERWVETELALKGQADLDRMLALPERSALPREAVEVRPVAARDGAPWRPLRGAPVLLLGDSFSAVYSQADLRWGTGAGLAERLSYHLGLPLDRIVRNAGGASATRTALASALAADPDRLEGVRVVVWELAAREITQGSWEAVPLPTTPDR